jgi:signal transduction histidine kinase
VVSHELRTPITIAEGSISNAQWIAQNSNKPEEIVKALNTAHDQIVFLANMMNDLATLSRAERGKLELELESINIHAMLSELAEGYKKEAEAKKLKIDLQLDAHLEMLSSSKLYVQEILQNLITNSLKYTKEGGLTITAKPVENGISVSVEDTGIGISKGDQEKIFDKFFRSEDFRTRESSGTGLGLYVTMKLIQLVHADIVVQSELNKGSTFTVVFPNLQ